MSVLEKVGWDYKKEYRRDWHPVSLYDYTSAEKYLEKSCPVGKQSDADICNGKPAGGSFGNR